MDKNNEKKCDTKCTQEKNAPKKECKTTESSCKKQAEKK